MKSPHIIDVAEKFTDIPFGRNDKDGQYNGEKFRKDILLKALDQYEYIEIDLDGTMGCGSSFGDEAFAGLVIYEGYTKEEVLRRISFKYKYKSVINNIVKYIEEAKPRVH